MCLMKELVTTQSLFSTSFVHISHLDTSWDHLRRALKKTKPMLFYYPQVNPLLAHYIYRTYLQKKSCTKEDRKSLFSDRKWRHVVCAWYSSLALMFKISRHKARGECQVTLPLPDRFASTSSSCCLPAPIKKNLRLKRYHLICFEL